MWSKIKHYGGEALMWVGIAVAAVAVVALVLGLIAGVFSLAIGIAVGLCLLKGVVPGIVMWLAWSYFDLAKDIPGVAPQFYDIELWKFVLGAAVVTTVVRIVTGRGLNLPKIKPIMKRGDVEVASAT